MTEGEKRLPVAFFQTESGREPVREWLKSLDDKEKLLTGTDIKTVEYGWPIGMPACEPLGKGLFAVRTNLSTDKIARVVFCIHEGRMILLHGFIKKSQRIPKKELDLALKRKSQLEREAEHEQEQAHRIIVR